MITLWYLKSQIGILPCDPNDKHTNKRVPIPKSSQGKVFGKGEQMDTDRGTLRKTITQNEQGHYMPIPHTELCSRIGPPIRKKHRNQILTACEVPPRSEGIKHATAVLPCSWGGLVFGEAAEILCVRGKRILHSKLNFRQLFLGKLFQLTSCEDKRCCRPHLSCCEWSLPPPVCIPPPPWRQDLSKEPSPQVGNPIKAVLFFLASS